MRSKANLITESVNCIKSNELPPKVHIFVPSTRHHVTRDAANFRVARLTK